MKAVFKKIYYIVLLAMVSACVLTKEEKQAKFEAKLNTKIGTMTQDIIQEYGIPTKYSNTSPIDASAMGAFMIYDYTRDNNDDCILVYKYSKKTLKILDWHYSGNCMEKD